MLQYFQPCAESQKKIGLKAHLSSEQCFLGGKSGLSVH